MISNTVNLLFAQRGSGSKKFIYNSVPELNIFAGNEIRKKLQLMNHNFALPIHKPIPIEE